MLAKPTTGVSVVLERFKGIEFTCEYKYDGFRGQIHFMRNRNETKIFSRNLEDMTCAYPDVIDIVKKMMERNPSINEFIVDSELIAYDTETNKILPF